MKRKPYWQVLGELNERDAIEANSMPPTVQPLKYVEIVRLCKRCMRRPANGKSRCLQCAAYERARRVRAEARGDCQKCYCRPAERGYKSCVACRESARKSREKYEKKIKERKNERR